MKFVVSPNFVKSSECLMTIFLMGNFSSDLVAPCFIILCRNGLHEFWNAGSLDVALHILNNSACIVE